MGGRIARAKKLIAFLQTEMGVNKIRFPGTSAIGIKPVSREGSERLLRAAFDYAIRPPAQEREHGPQGQHHEVHRGRVPRLGLRPGQTRIRRPRELAGTTAEAKPPAARFC